MAIDNGIEQVDESFIFFGYCSLIVFIVLLAWILPCYWLFYEILGIKYSTRKITKDETHLADTVNSDSKIDIDSKSKSNSSKDVTTPTTPENSHQKKSQQQTDSKTDKSFSRSRSQSQSAHKKIELPLWTKITLLIAVIFKFFYLVKNCYITILLFALAPYYSIFYCRIFFVVKYITVTIGHFITYIFFVARANDVFKGTMYQQSKCQRYSFVIYLVPYTLFYCISCLVYAFWGFSVTTILHIANHGGYCEIVADGSDASKQFFALTGIVWVLNEYFLIMYTIYVMVIRCFKLIFDTNKSERKEMSNSDQAIDRNAIAKFHKMTETNNRIVLISVRVIILGVFTVLVMQMGWILQQMFPNFINVIHSFTGIIEIYCLFLTFSFADDVYSKYFCKSKCTKCCFPIIKTLALTCHSDMHSKTCGCILCCCYCCRYCCISSKRKTQSQIYKMAKAEIELVVKT